LVLKDGQLAGLLMAGCVDNLEQQFQRFEILWMEQNRNGI